MFLSEAAVAARVYGVLKVVKGNVQVKSGKTGTSKQAKLGVKVYPTDTVITSKDSRAKIVMVDKNEINVSPDSQIIIQNYEFDPKENKKNVLLNVIYGKVRSKVNQKYDGKTSKFQVKTKSAVAGVRGTDFLASFSRQNNSTNIVTFEGRVSFGLPGANGTIINPVTVAVGQMATSVGGNIPTPPQPVPPGQLATMDKSSDAEKAQAPSNNDERQPADKDKKEKDQKKDNQGKSGEEKENKKDAKEKNAEGDKKASSDKKAGDDKKSSDDKKASGDKKANDDKKASGDKKSSNDKNQANQKQPKGDKNDKAPGSKNASQQQPKANAGPQDKEPRGPASTADSDKPNSAGPDEGGAKGPGGPPPPGGENNLNADGGGEPPPLGPAPADRDPAAGPGPGGDFAGPGGFDGPGLDGPGLDGPGGPMPGMTGDTMLVEGDLPTFDGGDFVEVFPGGDTVIPIGPEPLPNLDTVPICEFCNDVINNGSAILRIKVRRGN